MASITDPFSGRETFAADIGRVFGVVTNLDSLAKAVPGLVSSERVGTDAVRCVVKPGLSFIGGSVKATMSVPEVQAPERALIRVKSSGIGMTLDIDAALMLSQDAGGTALEWTAKVTAMTGLVKAAPAALVRAAADKVIRDGWTALRKEIEA
ncbi:MAG: hypothetical protein HBSAPP03_23770 [Phycisphaerae bacterium]|nr:MAG: hypothetical protein HBSAPP03_23770 [Phycisphaerae bacterium]